MGKPFHLLVPIGVLLFAYFGLVGAAQLPETGLQYIIAAWLMPAAVLLWARADALKNHRPPPPGEGIWFIVLGPVLVWYYLWRTRRERYWGMSLLLAGLVLSPGFGVLAGGTMAWAASIPPRYVQLATHGEFLRVTPELASTVAQRDFARIAAFLSQGSAAGRPLPADATELYARLAESPIGESIPYDLFTGRGYYYETREDGYVLWCAGPDRSIGTDDDLVFVWPPSTATS